MLRKEITKRPTRTQEQVTDIFTKDSALWSSQNSWDTSSWQEESMLRGGNEVMKSTLTSSRRLIEIKTLKQTLHLLNYFYVIHRSEIKSSCNILSFRSYVRGMICICVLRANRKKYIYNKRSIREKLSAVCCANGINCKISMPNKWEILKSLGSVNMEFHTIKNLTGANMKNVHPKI